jgi:hypothetical protein
MGIYTERGLALTFSGDLQIGSNGDLKLDNSFDTHKSAANWFVRTNKGDYTPDKRLGCDLGRYIGKEMSRDNLLSLENGALANLVKFTVNRGDVTVDAAPIDCDTIAVFVSLQGQYLDEDGKLLQPGTEVLTYVYPYIEGQPTPLP